MRSKKHLFIILSLIMVMIVFSLCEKEVTKVKEDEEPPVITQQPEVYSISSSSSTIYWITDEPCSVQVRYSISDLADTAVKSDNEFRQNHMVTLNDLDPNTFYDYKAVNFDVAGNITESGIYTFKTAIDTSYLSAFGWEAFESEEYSEAANSFNQLVQYDSLSEEGFTGLGWSVMRIDSLDSSITSFDNALDLNAEYKDAISGMVLALYKNREDLTVTIFGEQILEIDSVYVFEHDTLYKADDIHLILADSYNILGMLEEAQLHINIIFPENGLDPENAESWVVSDSTYSYYADALTDLIEYIKLLYWNNS